MNLKRLRIKFDGAQHLQQSDFVDDTGSVINAFLDDFGDFRRFRTVSNGFGPVSAKFGALPKGEMHGPTWPARC